MTAQNNQIEIVPAQLYIDEINKKITSCWYDLKYQYYFGEYQSIPKIETDNWSRHMFAIRHNNELIGYAGYSVSRVLHHAYGFFAINFTDNYISFGIAIRQIIDDIFNKYNFNKLKFMVTVGNPIEKTYDKLVEKYGGRIVGVFKQNVKVLDGSICDDKNYEILREDYLRNISNIPIRGSRSKIGYIDDYYNKTSILKETNE